MARLVLKPTTVADFRVARDVLKSELERLVKLVESYPVIFEIAGQRWIFESERHILDLIDEIDRALGEFDHAA